MNKVFYILLGLILSNSCFAYNVYSYKDVPITGQYIVSPAKEEIELEREKEEIVNIYFANQTGEIADCIVNIDDFKADDKVSLTEEGGMYSLKDYIFLPVKEFEIKHGDKIEVPLRINIPSYSNSGTLYCAVSFVCGDTAKTQISTLLFVNVEGENIRKGNIDSFDIDEKEFKLVYENKGNIYQKINGVIEIKDLFGNIKEMFELNNFFVLPESKRSLGNSFELFPGYYLAEVRIGEEIIKKGVWVEKEKLFLFLILVVGILIFILKKIGIIKKR